MNGEFISSGLGLPPASRSFSNPPPHRILVVEDDEDIRRLNAEALSGFGFEVGEARDGAEAWDAIQLNSYDLIVTDNAMPRVTGLELLKKIRAARMDLPVVMATGNPPLAEFNRTPWLQPGAILVKPYTVDELLNAVIEVLRASEEARALAVPSNMQNPRPEPQ